ncbi:hypothetical protein CVT24_011203 [Panaeolus cyanescens]|uniref:Uncharacterized protein n=1 Tax=Panaeolus cyanescens TaxID=181874 RepID=A0A409YG99_9AGAR|nr:hypothetical protein CVT24_011203 [Panaeolus cyanescens]
MSQEKCGVAEPSNRLPGFGLPLNYVPRKTDKDYIGPLLPNAISLGELVSENVALSATTLREISMLRFMNAITDKPDWHVKVCDDDIVKKWKAEVLASGIDFSRKMFKYCIYELRHNASSVSKSPTPPPIIVFPANVVKSDFAVSPGIKHELQVAMQKFEDKIPQRLRDWHPGSNEHVLDLVHPSLFPIVYGTTRILEHGVTTLDDCIQRCGEGKIADVPAEVPSDIHYTTQWGPQYKVDNSKAYSREFQWLPCEVDISSTKSRITSYINNLHPREKHLYELVEQIIDASIPLWGLTLAPLQRGFVDCDGPRRINYDGDEFKYDRDLTNVPQSEGPQRLPNESDEYFLERRKDWIYETRRVVQPEPSRFKPYDTKPLNIREVYGHRGIQIIVKFANIVLTPESPAYKGGSWHVEGQLNEHIVATSLYYYSSENITASSLSFRQQVATSCFNDATELQTDEQDYRWLDEVYGCPNYEPGVQVIGDVDTREGRLLTFPNILQHRVQPFKLADPTKPGHRKILALFLVDPNIKVVSTAHVPCQRKDWWKEVARREQILSPDGTGLGRLPVELQDIILDEVHGFPLDMDEAKALRVKLMEERKAYVRLQDETFLLNKFSLCEH